MMSSVATTSNVGVAGAVVSTVTARAPTSLTLPATSVATALMVVLASAGTSPLKKLALQLPPVAVTVLLIAPQVTTTLAPASAVPVTVTPAAFSAALTTSSVATALTDGVAVLRSNVKVKNSEFALRLPAASVWRALTDLAPSPVSVIVLPAPAIHEPPPLVLYSHVAPLSRPMTLTTPDLVILSVSLMPVSLTKTRLGATGRVVSLGLLFASLDTLLPAAANPMPVAASSTVLAETVAAPAPAATVPAAAVGPAAAAPAPCVPAAAPVAAWASTTDSATGAGDASVRSSPACTTS